MQASADAHYTHVEASEEPMTVTKETCEANVEATAVLIIPPAPAAPSLTSDTTMKATETRRDSVAPQQRHTQDDESATTIIPPPKTPLSHRNGGSMFAFRFPQKTSFHAAPKAAATVSQRVAPVLSPPVGDTERRSTNPLSFMSTAIGATTTTHNVTVNQSKQGQTSILKTPRFGRNNANRGTTDHPSGFAQGLTPSPASRYTANINSNHPATTGMFHTPGPIFGRLRDSTSKTLPPTVTPASSVDPKKTVTFAQSLSVPNAASKHYMHPITVTLPESKRPETPKPPPLQPMQSEPEDTTLDLRPPPPPLPPPGVDSNVHKTSHHHHNKENNFDDNHQAFVRSCRDTNDGVKVINDEILDLNVLLDTKQADMLLRQAEMVDLTSKLETMNEGFEQILGEFGNAFPEDS
jgi:hypothetical protein